MFLRFYFWPCFKENDIVFLFGKVERMSGSVDSSKCFAGGCGFQAFP